MEAGEKIEIEEKDYKKLKIRLEEVQRKKKGKIPILVSAFFAICIIMVSCFFIYDVYYDSMKTTEIIATIIVGVAIGFGMYLYIFMLYEMDESKIKRKMLEYEAENIKDEVKEDIFENSIKLSYKYLDQYYLQTREQAQRGFFVTVLVSVFGAILISVGIVSMFLEKVQPSYITCASGVITEFIAAVFFYLYNKTISSMSKYHNKLVISHNVSIALKVAESLPENDKVKAKNAIILELLKDVNTYLVKNDTSTE